MTKETDDFFFFQVSLLHPVVLRFSVFPDKCLHFIARTPQAPGETESTGSVRQNSCSLDTSRAGQWERPIAEGFPCLQVQIRASCITGWPLCVLRPPQGADQRQNSQIRQDFSHFIRAKQVDCEQQLTWGEGTWPKL